MAGQEKWYFTKEQLQNSPSRKCNLDADKELAYRQHAANLIQDMGQRLQVSQLCINTAIVYMHRFYAFHSFTKFHRSAIAAAALFLGAKVEEQPRKLEYVIKVAHICLHRGEGTNTLTPEQFQEQAQDLVFNENVLLQTLGFDVAIDHPHTHVVRTCHLVKAPKDLAQTSYFMASNSLHLTTMCLQYRPTVVACFCIHLASKWSNWAIPQSNEGRHWFSYVDRSVTSELLEKLTAEFLHIFDKCPSRLKRKMMTASNSGSSPHGGSVQPNVQGPGSGTNITSPRDKRHFAHDEIDKSFDKEYERERRRQPVPGGYVPATTSTPVPNPQQPQKIDYNVYREKKEREEREKREERDRRQQAALQQQQRPGQTQLQSRPSSQVPTHHQRPSTSQHHKPQHWPHHKPPHHKPPHDQRHHRPPQIPSTSTNIAAQVPNTEQVPQRTRPPSLFSPENSTTPTMAASRRPPSQPHALQRPVRPEHRPQSVPTVSQLGSYSSSQIQIKEEKPQSPRRRTDPSAVVREMQPPAILSPFLTSPPPVKEIKHETKQPRSRSHSNSEPELVPVVKKLDETPGYENVIRDSQRGNAIRARNSEQKRPDSVQNRSLNGIETDPTLVSNLLKESLTRIAPITVPTERKSPVEVKKEQIEPPVQNPPPQPPPQAPVTQDPVAPIIPVQNTSHHEEISEQKHKKEKKKKDKHKHKEREKSKEERKKHKKDKDKKKEPSPPPTPMDIPQDGILKITIPKEKLSPSPALKIKIPKERLAAPLPVPQSSSLKIKISKEVLETSKKRPSSSDAGPPPKIARQNGAPHPKVGNWSIPPPYRPPVPPYYMYQPPPPIYYSMGMDGYFYGVPGVTGVPYHHVPQPAQPPLPVMPPPQVPPPPPE